MAGVVGREIFFADVADVGAICRGGKGNIDAVIDNEWHVCFSTKPVQVACQLEQLERRGGLGAQLDGRYAAAQRGRDNFRELR